MSSKIVEDRLNNRSRVLRTRWHVEGDVLLKAGKFLEYSDALLRLLRQLDAISATVERLSLRTRAHGFGNFSLLPAASASSRAGRPGRPVGGVS